MEDIKQLRDERGFTLVEVLAALTIMAVISVTIIGYFVSAMDRSTEESRRVIAINLARLKAAELRDWAKQESSGQTHYKGLRNLSQTVFRENDPPFDQNGLLTATHISGTTYHYEVTLFPDEGAGSHTEWLDSIMGDQADKFLMRMIVKVYWRETTAGPSSAQSVTLDTYLVDRR